MIFCINLLFPIILMSKNPYFLIITLLLTTIYMIFMMNLIMLSHWFSFLILIILIGGLLIMFLYLISLIPKENMSMNLMLMFPPIMILFFVKSSFMNISISQMSMNPANMFIFPTIMSFLIMYLLFTLFTSVYLTTSKNGPLRLL